MGIHKAVFPSLLLTGLLALACANPAWANLYKCKDANNRTHYQDSPCQQLKAERLPGNLSRLSGEEEARGFFWKATAGQGTLFLLGSLHFGSQSLYPLPALVTDAFSASDVLVVEADIDGIHNADIAQTLRTKGRYEDKPGLEARVKPMTWQKTMELANTLGMTEEQLRPLKPWFASLALTAQALKQAGYTADLGIDLNFLKQAEGKKPVMELESVDGQASLLEGLSGAEQEEMLLQTVQELTRGVEYFKTLIDVWKRGDADAMDLITRQSFGSGQLGGELYKILFEDRNLMMANRLKDMAADGRTYFVVVGAAHMGGEKGILALLEEKGFNITQP